MKLPLCKRTLDTEYMPKRLAHFLQLMAKDELVTIQDEQGNKLGEIVSVEWVAHEGYIIKMLPT